MKLRTDEIRKEMTDTVYENEGLYENRKSLRLGLCIDLATIVSILLTGNALGKHCVLTNYFKLDDVIGN
jgi:hypothetical protein